MGKVRRPISAIKKANIASNKSKKTRKLDNRKKVKYNKQRGDDVTREPVTYYDLKKQRDKEKADKIQLAKDKKNKETKQIDDSKKSSICMQYDAVSDMLAPDDLDDLIKAEDQRAEENLKELVTPDAATKHRKLVEKAKSMLPQTAAEEEEEEEEVMHATEAERLHHESTVQAIEAKAAVTAAAAAVLAQRPTNALLPIKILDKVIQQTKPEQDTSDAEDSGIEASETEASLTDLPLRQVSVIEIVAQRKRKLYHKQVFIGNAATEIIRNPDEKLGKMLELVKLVYESDADIALTVRKMAALSLLQVFHSVLPAYKLATMDKPGVKLKKQTRAVALQEGKLLSRYKYYLKGLEAMLDTAAKNNFVPLHLKMAKLAISCFCELLKKHPVFNFSDDIIAVLVPYLSHKQEQLRRLVVHTFETIFFEDNTGKISLRLLKVVNSFIRKNEFNVHTDALRALLKLRVTRATALDASSAHKLEAARDANTAHHNLKKMMSWSTVKLSIKEKKRKRKISKLEFKLREKKREEARSKDDSIQTEMLNILFGLYVHVIKDDVNKKLFGVVLEGLASFGHLVNVEYFTDLLSSLERVLLFQTLTLTESIHCIQTVFRLLTGLGSALPNDPSNFSDKLYGLLLQITATDSSEEAVLPALRTLLLLFITCKKRISIKQSIGFVKRLSTLALSLPHSQAIPILMTVRSIMLNHRSTECLLDTSGEGSSGVYRAELDHPVHCNAEVSALWEAHLLARGYHPMTQKIGTHLYKGAPLLGEGCLPASFTKLNIEDLHRQYSSKELQLNPQLLHPDQHCGPTTGKWSTKQTRRILATHTFTPVMQSICEREDRIVSRLIRLQKTDDSDEDDSEDEYRNEDNIIHSNSDDNEDDEEMMFDAIEEMDFYPTCSVLLGDVDQIMSLEEDYTQYLTAESTEDIEQNTIGKK